MFQLYLVGKKNLQVVNIGNEFTANNVKIGSSYTIPLEGGKFITIPKVRAGIAEADGQGVITDCKGRQWVFAKI